MISILLILIAWFVEMPLWLSILITVLSGLRIVVKTVKFGIDLADD